MIKMKPEHIQRTDLLKLFLKCRNYDITPQEASQKILDVIMDNYDLKSKDIKDAGACEN